MVTRTYDDIHREFDEKEQQNLNFIQNKQVNATSVFQFIQDQKQTIKWLQEQISF